MSDETDSEPDVTDSEVPVTDVTDQNAAVPVEAAEEDSLDDADDSYVNASVDQEVDGTEEVNTEELELQSNNTLTADGFKYQRYGNSIIITGYTGAGGNITIPDTINGYTVTEIDWYAFQNNTSITSVNAKNTHLTKIGIYAFDGCTNLKSLSMPNTVTSIGANFIAKTTITSLVMPSSIKGDNAEYCLRGTTNLQSVEFPYGMKSIPMSVCEGSSVKSVTIPSTVTEIDQNAFQDCSNLESITLPSGLQKIHYKAFSGCSKLKSLSIPDGVTEIGKEFIKDTQITSLTLPSKLTEGRFCLKGANSLRDVSFSYGLKTLPFAVCEDSTIQSVSIPSTVTWIGDEGFKNCSNLASVSLPNGLTKIGKRAFEGCIKLSSLSIPDGVTSIGEYFIKDTKISSLVMPSKLTYAHDCLQGAVYLKSIEFRKGIQTIPGCFESASLKTIKLPSTVTKIGNDSFDGQYAFANCTNLSDVYYASPRKYRDYIDMGKQNEYLMNANWHYGTEIPPYISNNNQGSNNNHGSSGKTTPSGSNGSSTSSSAYSVGRQNMYRLYNPNSGEHFYTASEGERDSVIAAGWSYEGIGWYSDPNQSVPLYRQYNPNMFANNHNYTTNKSENDYLVSIGWQAEGIGWYGV